MSGVNYHAWTHRPKQYGGTDPLIGGQAVYAIEVFEIDQAVATGDGKFEFEIPEDLDGDSLTKVEAYVNTAGSGTTVQIYNETQTMDMLSTPITIDTGDLNSKDAATQPVVADNEVAWGDHLRIDVDAAGGAIGLGVVMYFFAATTRTIVIEGVVGETGAPGGITAFTGEWTTATNYTAQDSVSYNGSSYAAIDTHTSGGTSEPGVGVNWEDHWQLLATGGATTDFGLVTSLPGSPSDGDYCTYTDSLTVSTYQWRLQYVSGRASNKWLCVGGTPKHILVDPNAVVNTQTQVGATSHYYPTTSGSFAAPLAGDYDVRGAISINPNGSGANGGEVVAFSGSSLGSAIAANANPGATFYFSSFVTDRVSASASALLGVALLSTDAGTWKMRTVTAEVMPFAVG